MRVESPRVGLCAMTAILAFAPTIRIASAAAVSATAESAQVEHQSVFDPRARKLNNPV